jgi:hypothetical protein
MVQAYRRFNWRPQRDLFGRYVFVCASRLRWVSRHIPRPDVTVEGEELVRQRAEARCAAQALGIQRPILLGFSDGKLGDFAGDRSLIYRVTQRIAEELGRLRRASCGSRSLRMSSSQQTIPPTRSLAHEYQPLRGVITISGGREGLLPSILQ